MRRLPLLASMAAGLAAAGMVEGSLAPASAATRIRGIERISIVGTSIASPTASLIARGAFTGAGTFTFSPTGGVVKLPRGSFTVTTARDGRSIVDPTTCLVSHVYGTRYTLSNGTGAFRAITGSGVAHVSEYAILRRTSNGRCNQNGAPTAFQVVIRAAGPVTVG